MAKNTTNTLNEMRQAGLTNWFTHNDYIDWCLSHDWVKFETLRRNEVLELRTEKKVVDILSPEEMAAFVNELAGDDLYDCGWEYRWNAEQMVFEEIEYNYYYRIKE